MPVRPLAAYKMRPVHRQVVRKSHDIEQITLLTEGEPLSVRSMKRPMKVLKGVGSGGEDASIKDGK